MGLRNALMPMSERQCRGVVDVEADRATRFHAAGLASWKGAWLDADGSDESADVIKGSGQLLHHVDDGRPGP